MARGPRLKVGFAAHLFFALRRVAATVTEEIQERIESALETAEPDVEVLLVERASAGVLRLVRDTLPRAPSAFGWVLTALELYLSPPKEIAVVGDPRSEVGRAALAGLDPVVAVGPADGVPLLEGKTLVDGRPAVYVCERFACRAPVTDPSEL